ncbi:hypothetical protein ACTOB_002001 [Actinoplanes oblitus]|uniref:Sensor histidine kinase n=1 Tax=Actinoplanes oblitus TaxID=3040509 RepID=A0ABY8WMZ7_9ACTN|nr:hypothetical protein [Actinoplanes oblitus]WIM98401.1 hypothetical protein ACTOB_002001 [Actinoplanes oblitus]
MTRREIAKQRAGDAYLVLRGRPARPDYGILVVLPLVAAAGGALIALGLEALVSRRRAPERVAGIADAADRRLEPVGA